jgi:hypothetical protein
VLPFDFSKPLLEFGTPRAREGAFFRGSELTRESQTGNSHGSGSKKGTEEIPALDRILEVGHGSPPLVIRYNYVKNSSWEGTQRRTRNQSHIHVVANEGFSLRLTRGILYITGKSM